jgi:3-methyladenine DNA glycosylase Tag
MWMTNELKLSKNTKNSIVCINEICEKGKHGSQKVVTLVGPAICYALIQVIAMVNDYTS